MNSRIQAHKMSFTKLVLAIIYITSANLVAETVGIVVPGSGSNPFLEANNLLVAKTDSDDLLTNIEAAKDLLSSETDVNAKRVLNILASWEPLVKAETARSLQCTEQDIEDVAQMFDLMKAYSGQPIPSRLSQVINGWHKDFAEYCVSRYEYDIAPFKQDFAWPFWQMEKFETLLFSYRGKIGSPIYLAKSEERMKRLNDLSSKLNLFGWYNFLNDVRSALSHNFDTRSLMSPVTEDKFYSRDLTKDLITTIIHETCDRMDGKKALKGTFDLAFKFIKRIPFDWNKFPERLVEVAHYETCTAARGVDLDKLAQAIEGMTA